MESPLLGEVNINVNVERYKNVQELIKADPTRVLSYVRTR